MNIKLEILKIRLRPFFVAALITFSICIIYLFTIDSFSKIRELFPLFNTIMVFLTFLTPILFVILPIIFPNYKITGKLIITSDYIKVEEYQGLEHVLPFEKIKQLKFDFNETASDGGYGIRLGIHNHIFIIDKEAKNYHFQVKVMNPQSVRIINAKLDSLIEHFEVIKRRKGKVVHSLIIK